MHNAKDKELLNLLLVKLDEHNIIVESVFDGEERHKDFTGSKAEIRKQIIDIVFSVEIANIRIALNGMRGWIGVIPENDGSEMFYDYAYQGETFEQVLDSIFNLFCQ